MDRLSGSSSHNLVNTIVLGLLIGIFIALIVGVTNLLFNAQVDALLAGVYAGCGAGVGYTVRLEMDWELEMNLVSIDEACYIANVPTSTMRRWVSTGTHGIKARKVGKIWLVDKRTLPAPRPKVIG